MDLVSIMSNEKRKIAPDEAAAEASSKVKKNRRLSQQVKLQDVLNKSKRRLLSSSTVLMQSLR